MDFIKKYYFKELILKSFEDFGLLPELLEAIKEMGFEKPTPIQEKTIPFLLENDSDFIGLAQTGTGKTAAFGLPIIQKLDLNAKRPQAIIICPTRELCLQIENDLKKFSKYMKKVSVVAVYGGVSIDNQINKIAKGVQIVVATPGRMNDIIRRKKVDLSEIKTVVLDEADEMLDMGFQDELNGILEQTPQQKQTLLFSATMPKEVEKIAMQYLYNPYTIEVGKRNMAAENIAHHYYVVHEKDRYLALKRIVDYYPEIYGIVFCRTRMETKKIADNLIKDGYNADALHGDLSQAQRDSVMKKFRNKNLQILVATDVAARGIDVNNLTHIINYNLPDDFEIYTHRSGRTARAGKSGISIAIINLKEKWKIKRIEKIIKTTFEQKPVPEGNAICEKQLFALIHKVKNIEIDEAKIKPFLENVYKEMADFSKEEILKRFVYMEFDRLLEYYSKNKDINVIPEKTRGKSSERSGRKKDSKEFKRFFINIGSKDNIKPTDVIGFVNDVSGDRNIKIGAIDIFKSFTFVDIEKNRTNLIFKSNKKVKYNGKQINFEEAKSSEQENNRKDKKDKFSKNKRYNRRKK